MDTRQPSNGAVVDKGGEGFMETLTVNADSFVKDSVQLNMLDAINFAIPEVEKLTDMLKAKKESLESELLQHGAYAEAVEKAKGVLEERKKAKKTAMLQPICQEYRGEIKDLRSDLKRTKQVLSETSLRYVDQTGATQVSGLMIIRSARLVKGKRSFKK